MPLTHAGPSAAVNAAPRSQRVLDALGCIISLFRGPNESFKMEFFCFEKTIYHFPPFLVCRAARPWPVCLWHNAIVAGGGGVGTAQSRQKPEGSRCSEMHSQPYLSPKGVIPDENSSCFEK